jgi:site-specific recombinase XerD
MAASTAITVSPGTLPTNLQDATKRAGDFARAEKAPSTRKAYRTDFELFQVWCSERSVVALPAQPETVAAFIATEAARCKASTIKRRLAAIRYAHKLAALPSPTDDERLKATVRGIRRTIGIAAEKKAPATNDRLLAMVAFQDKSIASLRNRALLLLGFAGAFRRSELVALDLEDVTETPQGLMVLIRRGKTDQEGAGTTSRFSTACGAWSYRQRDCGYDRPEDVEGD